jgi:hypothetical protein
VVGGCQPGLPAIRRSLVTGYFLESDSFGCSDSQNNPMAVIAPFDAALRNSESGDYWAITLPRFHRNNLKIRGAFSAHTLFSRSLSDTIFGVPSSFVNDIKQTRTEEFKQDVMQ